LHLDPASSSTLPAAGNGSITQNLKITNSQHGKVDGLFFFCYCFAVIICVLVWLKF